MRHLLMKDDRFFKSRTLIMFTRLIGYNCMLLFPVLFQYASSSHKGRPCITDARIMYLILYDHVNHL